MTFHFRRSLFGIGLIALSACAQQSSSPVTPLAPASYAALGASDAVGVGASVPCGTNTPTNPSCPGGTGYVPKIAMMLENSGRSIDLTDLGISSAVIGPDIKALGNRYGTLSTDLCQPRGSSDAIPADFLTNEVPDLPIKAGFVTIFTGANDAIALAEALGCGAGGSTATTEQAFIAIEATAFASDYASIIAAVKRSSPAAHIVVANIPNLAAIPLGLTEPATARQALQALSVAIDTAIDRLTTVDIPVVDLLCNSQSYIATNYSSDGFHPNDVGYASIASLMEPLLVSDTVTPLSPNCAQAALMSTNTQGFGSFTVRMP